MKDPEPLHVRIDAIAAELVSKGIRLDEAAREFERRFIAQAMAQAGGNKSDAAKLLGVHRNTLASKLNSHGDGPPRRRRRKARRRPSRTAK